MLTASNVDFSVRNISLAAGERGWPAAPAQTVAAWHAPIASIGKSMALLACGAAPWMLFWCIARLCG